MQRCRNRECLQDEYGTAAIKTVELDDSLGGLPVQWREVQDHESSTFLSYFKKGIKYLLGGHDSGFRHVGDEEFQPRLLQCKGKRNVRVRQVPLAFESLNRGDVFILDTGEDIFVWMPPKAGRLERIKGVHHANNIRDQERAGRGNVVVLGSSLPLPSPPTPTIPTHSHCPLRRRLAKQLGLLEDLWQAARQS